MNTPISFTLERRELEQLLEGLSERAENWEEIRESLRGAQSRRADRVDRRSCPASSLAGLTAVRIASDYRKILDRILERAQAFGCKP